MGNARAFLGSDPFKALGRVAFMWRFLYDAGRPEVVGKAVGDVALRVWDFPVPDRIWCERTCGFLEGCVEVVGVRDMRVEETACVTRDAAWCEFHGTWGSSSASGGESTPGGAP